MKRVLVVSALLLGFVLGSGAKDAQFYLDSKLITRIDLAGCVLRSPTKAVCKETVVTLTGVSVRPAPETVVFPLDKVRTEK